MKDFALIGMFQDGDSYEAGQERDMRLRERLLREYGDRYKLLVGDILLDNRNEWITIVESKDEYGTECANLLGIIKKEISLNGIECGLYVSDLGWVYLIKANSNERLGVWEKWPRNTKRPEIIFDTGNGTFFINGDR